ncbi:MAG: glucose 1-dehydrogenase [Thermincola sp.]|nr:glucose 1-dehydrogenase [Thermincola sp.]MDT3704576.1 glucose 1-dehydrogenase [Thermincola sp.]
MNLKNLFDLSGKTAVITGGATGLGKQMAEALAEFGANVVLAARKVERCETAASEIRQSYGVEALAVECDLAREEDIVELVSRTVKAFGCLDILVNNSGITWGAPADQYPLDRWQQVINVNLTGSFIAAKEAFKVMKKQGSGKIISIASVFGLVGAKGNIQDAVAYNASKGALLNLTKDLAVKWAPMGVNVNAVAPGWFPTHIAEAHIAKHRTEFLDYIPADRFGNDDDLKGAVVYLASKASDYVHGQVLVVDGGWTIH